MGGDSAGGAVNRPRRSVFFAGDGVATLISAVVRVHMPSRESSYSPKVGQARSVCGFLSRDLSPLGAWRAFSLEGFLSLVSFSHKRKNDPSFVHLRALRVSACDRV